MITLSASALKAAAPLFDPPGPDRSFYEERRGRPLPERSYVVMFTPRSGSTWLTDVVASTRRLGRPGEFVNPSLMPRVISKWGTRDLGEHLNLLMRQVQSRGTFGIEATIGQVEAVFGSADDFAEAFGGARWVWLARRDIVAQAVSLQKMVARDVTHSSQTGDGLIRAADAGWSYDPDGIAHWLTHIARMEARTEDLFERRGIEPLRMSYERNMARPPFAAAKDIARHLGVALPRDRIESVLEERQTKVGTSLNEEYAARFRQDRAAFVARAEAGRARTVAPMP